MVNTRPLNAAHLQSANTTPISFTGTTTAASNQVTGISSMTGLATSQEITGVGIIAGTTISALNVGASSLTLSQNASNSNTVPITAYPLGAIGAVPASPAKSRSRSILGADGVFRGITPNVYNYNFDDVRRLRRFRAARGAIQSAVPVINGVGPTNNSSRNILIFGDSPATGNEPLIPNWKISPWYAAFNMLNASSFGNIWRWDSGSGYLNSLTGPASLNGDTDTARWPTAGAGWSLQGSFPGLPTIFSNSTDTTSLVFAPAQAWDTMDIIYRSQTAGVQWSYTIGAGSPVTVTQAGSDRMVKLTITAGSNAIQSLTLNRISGNVQLAYFNPYTSTKYQLCGVQLACAGGSGVQLSTVNSLQSPAVLNTLFSPALVIFHFGYEIAGQRSSPGIAAATVVSNWITAMNTLTQAWQALGVDVMWCSMHPWDDTNLYKDQATVLQAREATYQVADTNNIPMIDNFARWGSWTEAVAAGFIVHYARPMPAGGHDLGAGIYQALTSF